MHGIESNGEDGRPGDDIDERAEDCEAQVDDDADCAQQDGPPDRTLRLPRWRLGVSRHSPSVGHTRPESCEAVASAGIGAIAVDVNRFDKEDRTIREANAAARYRGFEMRGRLANILSRVKPIRDRNAGLLRRIDATLGRRIDSAVGARLK